MLRIAKFMSGLGDGLFSPGSGIYPYTNVSSGDPNYMPPADTYVGSDGCVYDTDGNRLTCPGGDPNSNASGVPMLSQQPTETDQPTQPQGSPMAAANAVGAGLGVAAAKTSATVRRMSFGDWLSQPVAKGWPSAGAVILGTGVLAILLNSGGRRRR